MSAKIDFNVDLEIRDGARKRPRAEYSFDRDLNGTLSFQEFANLVKGTLLQVSLEALREEQGKGFDKNPVTRVDNRVGRPIEQVNPFGKIEFASRVAPSELLIETYRQIFEKSPFRLGIYQQYNVVTVNGVLVARNIPELQAYVAANKLKEGDVIKYINLTPYAGRLERLGVRRGSQSFRERPPRDKNRAARGVKVAIPNGAYFLSYRQVKRKFGANTKIFFEFSPGRNIIDAVKPTGRQPGRTANFRTDFSPNISGQKFKGPYVYPTIRIVYNERGFL